MDPTKTKVLLIQRSFRLKGRTKENRLTYSQQQQQQQQQQQSPIDIL